MNIKDIEADIAKLNEQLKKARDLEKNEREALRKATNRVWKFTFAPATGQRMSFNKNRDSAMQEWYLHGEIVNKDACLAAGWSEDALRAGGMGYWFNSCSSKIAFNVGGGNIYISEDIYRVGTSNVKANEQAEDADVAFRSLEQFIIYNPKGGDVTDIILAQRHFGWRNG